MGRLNDSSELTQAISAILQKHHAEIRALGLSFVGFKDSAHQTLEEIQAAVAEIRSRLPRRAFPAKTKRIYREVSLLKFGGRCQIHPTVVIVDHTGRATPESEYDHFIGHSENGIDQGWIVSRRANRTLRNQREQYRPEFEIFQRELKAYLNGTSPQPRPTSGLLKPSPGGSDQIQIF